MGGISKRGESDTYTTSVEENLIDGTIADFVRGQLGQGSGSELVGEKPKFQSVGSSSALAANMFVPWMERLNRLHVGGITGFQDLKLEKKMSSGLGGAPPNLDVYLGRDSSSVFVETKFLEPISRTIPKFSESYRKIDDGRTTGSWYQLYEGLLAGDEDYVHLDVAQLVKHFFGITNPKHGLNRPALIYLYWEPDNADEIEEFVKHRSEVKRLKEAVRNDPLLEFQSLTCRDLWSEWEQLGDWESAHVQRLRGWYELSV